MRSVTVQNSASRTGDPRSGVPPHPGSLPAGEGRGEGKGALKLARAEILLRAIYLNIAKFYSLAQRLHLVAERDEFLADVTLVLNLEQRAHDRRVVEFLCVVDHARDRKSTRLNSSH